MRRPAVFLDRDGVINRAVMRDGTPRPPASLEQCEVLPRVAEALSALKAHGFSRVVVTNQPDVARGISSRELVDSIHARLASELDIDAILTCFHDDADACECRKPKPGLLLRAARDLGIDLASSFMVGDRRQDVEAGRRAGCRTFWVVPDHSAPSDVECDFRVSSLFEASRIILGREVSR